MTKSKGYSYNFVRQVFQGNADAPGNALGRLCIEHDVPVADVAKALGVSRQTAYSWFVGKYSPTGQHMVAVRRLIAKLSNKGV